MNLRSRSAAVGVAAALVFGALGCGSGAGHASDSDSAAAVADDSMGVAPIEEATVRVRSRRNLRESSALAMSIDQPGVLFTINDSGNEAVLFAVDTTGADRGTWRVRGATNVDWEALAIGPCGPNAAPRCLYVGDVGDNEAHHSTRTVYRVPEPRARDSSFSGTTTAERVTFHYDDGRHDVEAMYVAANADVYLITKRALVMAPPKLRPALVFRIPASAWRGKRNIIATLVDSLSLIPGSAPLRTITDASLSADGRHIGVRTYTQLFVYAADSATGRVNGSIAPAICDLTPLGEAQGEGLAWVESSGRFAFSSEGRAAPLHIATCPLPQ